MRRSGFTWAVSVLAAFVSAAARADVPAYTMSGFGAGNATTIHYSIGYTFALEQPTTISALGALDIGGNSITNAQPMLVKVYWSSPTPNVGVVYPAPVGHGPGGNISGFFYGSANVSAGDPILSLSGGAYTSGDGFRYHTLDTPIVLTAGWYMIQESNFGTGFKGAGQNVADAATVQGPFHATYNTFSDDAASYGNSTGDSFLPGGFGPNFLFSVPEPGALALLGAVESRCFVELGNTRLYVGYSATNSYRVFVSRGTGFQPVLAGCYRETC